LWGLFVGLAYGQRKCGHRREDPRGSAAGAREVVRVGVFLGFGRGIFLVFGFIFPVGGVLCRI
jgi:hypothetical protein